MHTHVYKTDSVFCLGGTRKLPGCFACERLSQVEEELQKPGKLQMRDRRNTVGNLIEICWLKENYHGAQFTGICVKQRV